MLWIGHCERPARFREEDVRGSSGVRTLFLPRRYCSCLGLTDPSTPTWLGAASGWAGLFYELGFPGRPQRPNGFYDR